MRRRIKRSSLFTMVAIVALLSLGIGYAAWTSDLKISGTLDTTSVNVTWSDYGVTNGPAENCTLGATDPQTLSMGIVDAYPGVTCTFSATINNNNAFDVQVVDGSLDPPTGRAGFVPSAYSCSGAFGSTGELAAGGTSVCTWTIAVNGQAEENTTTEHLLTAVFGIAS